MLFTNIPLFLKRVGVRGRKKTLFSGKEVFPFPENKLPLSGTERDVLLQTGFFALVVIVETESKVS